MEARLEVGLFAIGVDYDRLSRSDYFWSRFVGILFAFLFSILLSLFSNQFLAMLPFLYRW